MKHGESNTNLPELLLLKLLPLSYHHSHFLAATSDFRFHVFFTIAFLGATHFFYSWAVLHGLDRKTHAVLDSWKANHSDCMLALENIEEYRLHL